MIAGLDISYSSLGMCVLPSDLIDGGQWDWRRVAFRTCARQPMTPAGRDQLALDVRVFLIRHGVRRVFAENIPHTGFHTLDLAKLHAIIERELYRECGGLEMEIANQSTARKLMFGRGRPAQGLSDKEKKAWVTEPLRLMGAPFANHDEADALVSANFALSECGAPCFVNLLGEPDAKRAKRSRAA